MRDFNLSMPTKICFGEYNLDSAIRNYSNCFFGNILIVTGKTAMKRLGYIDRVEKDIRHFKQVENVFVFSKVSSNPKISEINLGIKFGRENKVNLIIALGGGSAIDAAKAMAIGIGNDEEIEKFFYNNKKITSDTIPVIAIPTTAGTGTELSRGAIITDDVKKIKKGIKSEYIIPKLAIVDSSLTYELPEVITMESGFDVLTHAIESYISRRANIFTEMLSLEAIKLVSESLEKIKRNIDITESRKKMSYASMIMGINLANSSTCLPHRLQYPVGAITDSSHGLGLASLYESWIYNTYEFSKEKFDCVGTLIAGKQCNNKQEVIASINIFIEKIGLSETIKTICFSESDLDKLEEKISGSIENDPASVDHDIISKIYRRAYIK